MNLQPFTQVLGVPWFYTKTPLEMKPIYFAWTPEEDELICKHYPMMHTEDFAQLMFEKTGTGRSLRSITARARFLGVKKEMIIRKRSNGKVVSFLAGQPPKRPRVKETGMPKQKRNSWTNQEIKKLIELYPHHTSEELAEVLEHPINAIRCKGSKLGLKKTQETLLRARKKGER